MSGGRNDPRQQTPTPAGPLPAYENAPTTRTVQPSMPGGLEMQANQLAQGFAPNQQSRGGFMDLINSIYSPMQQTVYQEPISATLAGMAGGKFAPISTGNPSLDAILNAGKKDATKTAGGLAGTTPGTPAPLNKGTIDASRR